MIFFSYAAEDGPFARSLAEALGRLGYSTWMYERESMPVDSYLRQVNQAIRNCDAVLLLASRHSLRSNEVAKEVERAHKFGKLIVPLLRNVSQAQFDANDIFGMACGTAVAIDAGERTTDQIVREIDAGLKSAQRHHPPKHDDGEPGPDEAGRPALTSRELNALRTQLKVLAELNEQIVQNPANTREVAERLREWKKQVSAITNSDFIYELQSDPSRQGPYATLRNTMKQCRRAIERLLTP